ncbi:MAG: DUF362 domain-containing protein [Candidatus Aminicenantaceae bacterium]
MNKTKVSIVKLEDYKSEKIYRAINQSIDLIGKLENILKPKSNVFVKINHLSPSSPPEKGIVTHPAFTREVLRLLRDLDCKVTVGDDIQSNSSDGFLISGYRQVCKEMGIPLINLKEKGFQEVSCNGKVLAKAYISPLCLEADYIVNLPKLKTHSFTVFTGAVKNMFGIIPYGLRLRYHRLYIKNNIFSQMLLDIFSCAPPHLTIMDGVIAMEGEGPSAGKLKKVGVIITGQDAVAVDAVATKIVGYNPMDIYTTYYADERGLGVGLIENIETVGEKLHNALVRDFKHSTIAIGLLQKKLPSFLHAYFQDQLTLIPEVIKDKCTACLECINICPVGAAKLSDGIARIEKKICIHCMCCHEVCRDGAVKLKQRPMGKIVRGVIGVHSKIQPLLTRKRG